MLSAVLEEFHADLALKELPIPVPGRGEVLIKVKASGLCATDLHIQDGRLPAIRPPYVPGHETAGIIAAIGEEIKDVRIGDSVIVALDILCGHCRYCQTGRGNLCRNLVRLGFERNGGHEEYMVAPARNVLKFDSTKVSFEKAAIIPDAVACMYHAIRNKGDVRALDTVCLLGIGGLGFQGIQIAKYFGATVFCTSRQQKKLDFALSMGADCGINTAVDDVVEKINELTHNEQCDVVFDNIGTLQSVQTALDICRPGGKVVLVGYSEDIYQVQYQGMVMKEKEIIGIRGSNRRDLAETIWLVESGAVDPFVSNVYPLRDINQAMAALRAGKSMGRTVLVMD